MFLHIKKASHIGEYRLRIEFNNGVTKDVDLAGELHGEIYEPLKSPDFFTRVSFNPDT